MVTWKRKAVCWPFQVEDGHTRNHSPPTHPRTGLLVNKYYQSDGKLDDDTQAAHGAVIKNDVAAVAAGDVACDGETKP